MSSFTVQEQTTPVYEATMVDENTVPIPGGSLLSLTLTVYEVSTAAIVNSRQDQNVLQTNGVHVDSSGVLRWILGLADTTILVIGGSQETHRAQFTFTWNPGDGVRTARHQVDIVVENWAFVG